jgi:hypothetical protein
VPLSSKLNPFNLTDCDLLFASVESLVVRGDACAAMYWACSSRPSQTAARECDLWLPDAPECELVAARNCVGWLCAVERPTHQHHGQDCQRCEPAAHHCAAGQTTLSSTLSSADSKRTRRRHLRRRQSADVAIKRFCRRSMMFKTSTKSNIGSTRSWATAWGFYPRHVKTLRRDDKYRIDDYFS